MRDPRRKFLSLGNHFFERLKTADSSTACGTSTLKSPLLRGFDAPHVHPRLRKCPPGCTLDCGFKTSESPALRGFVGGLRALATAALDLVLKSNGLRHPKNLPVKFGFRPKPFPQISPKSYRHNAGPNRFSSHFSTFRTNGPRSLLRVKAGTHSPLPTGSHTTAHTAKQVVFWVGVVSLPSERSARSRTSPGRVPERRILPLLGLDRVCSQRTQRAFGTAMRLCASLSRRRRGPAGPRDLFRFCRNCGLYALRSGPFRVCEARGGITTLGVLCVFSKRRTAACQNGSFAVF